MLLNFWTLESPLDCKKIQPVNPKGNQSWIFIGRTDAEAETPILWPSDVKSWLIKKDPDAGKVLRQEKGITEYEMAGWHHWLNGREFEQVLGDGEGQGSLVCCSLGVAELDTTVWLNKQSYRELTSWLLALPFSVKAGWPCLSYLTSWFLIFHIYNIVIPLHKGCCNN